jgi:hypothetical protein
MQSSTSSNNVGIIAGVTAGAAVLVAAAVAAVMWMRKRNSAAGKPAAMAGAVVMGIPQAAAYPAAYTAPSPYATQAQQGFVRIGQATPMA